MVLSYLSSLFIFIFIFFIDILMRSLPLICDAGQIDSAADFLYFFFLWLADDIELLVGMYFSCFIFCYFILSIDILYFYLGIILLFFTYFIHNISYLPISIISILIPNYAYKNQYKLKQIRSNIIICYSQSIRPNDSQNFLKASNESPPYKLRDLSSE
jgi:hypothetical protein